MTSAALIKELRERTGVSMTKCKEALEECQGNIDEAISLLRKRGMASAVKKEGRATNEGTIVICESDRGVALVEGNAETDFVVKNDRFQKLMSDVSRQVLATDPQSLEELLAAPSLEDPEVTVDQYRAQLVQVIGENIQIRRFKLVKKEGKRSLGVYSHLDGKIVVVVILEGSDQEQAIARDIAMHVAAAAPEYVSPDKVPQELIAHEREIATAQVKDKPAYALEKILEGKLRAFYETHCLLCQKYIRDDSLTVEQLLEKRSKEIGQPLTVRCFLRWTLGS